MVGGASCPSLSGSLCAAIPTSIRCYGGKTRGIQSRERVGLALSVPPARVPPPAVVSHSLPDQSAMMANEPTMHLGTLALSQIIPLSSLANVGPANVAPMTRNRFAWWRRQRLAGRGRPAADQEGFMMEEGARDQRAGGVTNIPTLALSYWLYGTPR